MAIRKISEVQKVVLIKTKKSKGGKGGVNQPIPKDVKIESLGEVGGEEDEEKEGEEKGQDEKQGNQEGKGEKKEEVSDEGEKGEGEAEEGEDGEKKEKKDGEGKDGEKDKEGEGEGDGKEDGDGEGEKGKPSEGKGAGTSDEDPEKKDIEKIQKQAEELLNKIKGVDEQHQQCGSVDKRTDKQNKEGVDKDTFNEQEKFTRERIKSIMDEEAASGKDHPLRDTGGGQRGEGKGSGGPRGEIIAIPTRKPEFLRKMKQFAEKEYEKQYYKKGTDWLYTQSYENVVFKDRPKVALPKKSLYILIDVSGSMDSNVDSTGQTILEYMIGYLPTIAADFVGEVWWMSDGILLWSDGPDKGKPAITPLSFFKGKSSLEMSKFYRRVQNASGSGGGTVFNVEFQAIQKIREKEGHNAPIIALTDGYIDTVSTQYEWPLKSKNVIKGKLPPNTYMMCFADGIKYLEGYYNEDVRAGYFSYEKNIQYYDLTENGRFGKK